MTQSEQLTQSDYDRLKDFLVDNVTRLSEGDAVSGENYEGEQMYPKFIEDAKEEGKAEAEISFKFALAAEKVHEQLYKKALETLESGEDITIEKFQVCPVCGMTFENEGPDKCPICGAEKPMFIEVV